jgi:hypothetical protein
MKDGPAQEQEELPAANCKANATARGGRVTIQVEAGPPMQEREPTVEEKEK